MIKENLYKLCLIADKYSEEQLELAIDHQMIPGGKFDFPKKNYYELCNKYLDKFSEQIYLLTKNNIEGVDLVFEICQYILPVMMQDEYGINIGIVVFVITLLCRKGIMNYIKKI